VAKLVEIDARARIAAVKASLRQASLRSRAVADAVDQLEGALRPSSWSDGAHLRPTRGAAVFDQLVSAVRELGKYPNAGHDASTVAQAARDLVAVSRLLAVIAVEEAAPSSDRELASTRLAQGDEDAAQGKYADAVRRYGQAWALVA
jgi:hypothetical protein